MKKIPIGKVKKFHMGHCIIGLEHVREGLLTVLNVELIEQNFFIGQTFQANTSAISMTIKVCVRLVIKNLICNEKIWLWYDLLTVALWVRSPVLGSMKHWDNLLNMAITLANIDSAVQLRLRNIVESPLSQSTRVEAYNRVIDFLQSKSNWNQTRRVQPWTFLNTEIEFSIANDLDISDLKQVEEIRFLTDNNTQQTKEFEEIDSKDFSIRERQNIFNDEFCIEERDNAAILRILTDLGHGDTIIDDMDDLTTGRTWASDTSTSDATTLVQDTTRAKNGNSLRFNISVSQSANNRAAIYTSTVLSTVVDASEIENVGFFRFWVGLHSMTAANLARMSGVTFVWGSEASATPATKAHYWSLQTTTPLLGGSFKAGWNRMSFPWEDATKTGSPDAASLRYFEIQLDYTAAMTNTNNIRIDQIKMFEPVEAEMVYFSNFFVSKSGVLQENFTTGTVDPTEQLVLPQRHMSLFIALALMELFPQKEKNNNDYLRVEKLAKEKLSLAILHDGNAITREQERFQVGGNSNGRDIGTQW